MIYLIILIFSLIIISIGTTETFTCNRNLYYTNDIFRPYRMITSSKKYSNDDSADNIITKNSINKVLEGIDIKYSNKKILEFKKSGYNYKHGFTGVKYDKSNLDIANKLLSNILIKNIDIYLDKNKKNICNGNCELKLTNYRIKRLGGLDNKLAIEGQQIFELIHGSKNFLIEYVILYKDTKIDILSLKLGGIQYKSIINEIDISENDINQNKLNIFGSPLYGRYDLPKTHIYSSTEMSLKPVNKFKNIDVFPHYCYGKQAVNKIECERNDGSGIFGIWDKTCNLDTECPFYNSQTKEGSCISGQCELPIGVTRISPRKYINLKNALCKGCIENGPERVDKCCENQKDRKKYPNITKPQYIFNGIDMD